MSGTRPLRAAIVGFHGFGNLGDEAILLGMEELLAPLAIEVRWIFGGSRLASSPAFPHATRLRPPRLLPGPAAIRTLYRADVLILGGGGLFHDHWPAVVPRYLAWVAAARLARSRVVWLGVGVGPIRRAAWRWMTRVAAGLSILALVRDAASARLLGSRALVMPDPALFLAPPVATGASDGLGIIVRPPISEDAAARKRVEDAIELVATAGRAAGLGPILLLMAPSVDVQFAAALGSRLNAPVETLEGDPRRALERLAAFEATASVRLHGLLLSALAGVPCLPIAYDAKVTEAAARLGLADVVIQPGDLTAQGVMERLDTVRGETRTAVVAERVAGMRSQAEQVRSIIRRALELHG